MCAQNKWGKIGTIIVQDDSVLPQWPTKVLNFFFKVEEKQGQIHGSPYAFPWTFHLFSLVFLTHSLSSFNIKMGNLILHVLPFGVKTAQRLCARLLRSAPTCQHIRGISNWTPLFLSKSKPRHTRQRANEKKKKREGERRRKGKENKLLASPYHH